LLQPHAEVLVIPDQLQTGVSDPCRYESGVQRSYAEWARHYGTVVLPARPAKPRDKAKVEVGVRVAEPWILARRSQPPADEGLRRAVAADALRPL
jgi:transposase